MFINMANQAISNLHKSLAEFAKEGSFVGNLRDKFSQISDRISSNIPSFLGAEVLSGQKAVGKLKKQILQKLDKKRKKFRLALESLGWGTIADMLDAALCGEKLNVWV
jgi:hypothetical protein